MVPLVLVAAVLLLIVTEKPLVSTIERDILPESLGIDGANMVVLPHRHGETEEATAAPGPTSR
jgi:hypothetical protein